MMMMYVHIYIFVQLFFYFFIFFAHGHVEYKYFSNWPIWLKDGTLTDTTNPSPNGPVNNGNESVLHTARLGSSLSDTVWCHTQNSSGYRQRILGPAYWAVKYICLKIIIIG